MSKLPARTGWLWLTAGFALFRKQPGMLILLLFANLGLSLVISSVPVVGPMLAMILIPSFTMALLQACRDIDEGRRTTLPVLAIGFQGPAVLRLCKLGLVYLVVALVLTWMARTMVTENFWVQISKPVDPASPPELNSGDVMSLMANVRVVRHLHARRWMLTVPGRAADRTGRR